MKTVTIQLSPWGDNYVRASSRGEYVQLSGRWSCPACAAVEAVEACAATESECSLFFPE